MNYLKEVIAFSNFAMLNGLSSGPISLWYALMAINNKCGWKEWFSAPRCVLEGQSGLSAGGIKRARDRLLELDLIKYRPRGRQASEYKINSLQEYAESGEICERKAEHKAEHKAEQEAEPLYKQNKNKQNKTYYNKYPKKRTAFNNYDDDNRGDYKELEENILDMMLSDNK